MIKHMGPLAKNFRLSVSGLDAGEVRGLAWVPYPTSYRILGGKNDGKIPEDTDTVAANSAVRIGFGQITVRRGFVRVIVNPVLAETSSLAHPVLIEEKNTQELFLIIRAHKGVDLSSVDWLIKLYGED